MKIDFAYRTFKWHNEAKGNAAVYCVIIGFSNNSIQVKKEIYESDNIIGARNTNQYLVNAPCIWVDSRTKPICNVPQMIFGSMPNGKELLMDESEYEELIMKEPAAKKYIRPFKMGKEFLNNINRYCLWLNEATPKELKQMPLVLERVEMVKISRSGSKRSATKELANTPMLFGENRQPDSDYVALPAVSSEKRRYIPIGFLDKNIIAGNKLFIVPNSTLYHFGILTSNVHMAWMRTVCGRLEMRYNYSNTIVYNNFPWPNPTDVQKTAIQKCAQEVLEARKLYSDSTLAELYDPLIMPKELLKAHRNLDKAVCKAYGTISKEESECVADLMKMYKELLDTNISGK